MRSLRINVRVLKCKMRHNYFINRERERENEREKETMRDVVCLISFPHLSFLSLESSLDIQSF